MRARCALQVPCLCLTRSSLGLSDLLRDGGGLRGGGPGGGGPGGGSTLGDDTGISGRGHPRLRAVTLLVIDTEGSDLEVLRQWPFESLPTWRVVFEARHMSDQHFEEAAALLERRGFFFLGGAYGAFTSDWHHADAP